MNVEELSQIIDDKKLKYLTKYVVLNAFRGDIPDRLDWPDYYLIYSGFCNCQSNLSFVNKKDCNKLRELLIINCSEHMVVVYDTVTFNMIEFKIHLEIEGRII